MTEIASIKLSDLAQSINQALKNVFLLKTYWIIADITNYSRQQQKGYHYFDLVEKDPFTNQILARIQASAWGPGSEKIREFEQVTGQRFQNDIHVLVLVSVDYHPVFGLKLVLLNIDPNFSIGLLEQARQATLKRLLNECSDFISKSGDQYITRNKQLALPAVIQRVAVISSGASAALQDFIHTLEYNKFGYRLHLRLYHTLVQGEANAKAFYDTLIQVFDSGQKYDVVVIIRGGGAQTDFHLFDQFILARVVAKFPIPIITGIGHQKDETIVDMMAHSPTKTPTKAAEYIIAHNRSFEEQLLVQQRTVIIRAQQLLSGRYQLLNQTHTLVLNRSRTQLTDYKEQLNRFTRITMINSKAILFRNRSGLFLFSSQLASQPGGLINNRLNDLKNLDERIRSNIKVLLSKQKVQIDHFDIMARLMSPVNILKKGFAIVYHNDKITSESSHLKPGDQVDIRFADTILHSTILSKNNTDGDLFNL